MDENGYYSQDELTKIEQDARYVLSCATNRIENDVCDLAAWVRIIDRYRHGKTLTAAERDFVRQASAEIVYMTS